MSDKKYISIPTIDNVQLPQSLINKCREVYKKYGKYKLYDILNADLNNHAKYSYSERQAFKQLELTKRYLYLYRKAMAETMGFAYNDSSQTELIDSEEQYYDDTNICPYCGSALHINSQIGKLKGFPKSHYRDVYKEYNPVVLFNKFPKLPVLKFLGDYISTKTAATQVGYEFKYWSLLPNEDDRGVDIYDTRVTEADPETEIDDDTYAAMTDEDKSKVVTRANISLLYYVDSDNTSDNYGQLKIYAIYKSNTDSNYMSITNTFDITVQDVIDIYCEDLYSDDDNTVYKSAFEWLETKSDYYEFSYMVAHEADSVPEDEDIYDEADYSETNVVPYIQTEDSSYSISVTSIFTPKSIDDANYIDYDYTIRQLAIQVLKEPYLSDIVYDSDGNATEYGTYSFFWWSLDDEASIYILEDDNSYELVRNLDSIEENNTLKIYALFKYDLSENLKAYDDDCYASVHRVYTGIDLAYGGELVTEYYTDDSSVSVDDKYLSSHEYSLLSSEEQDIYSPQESYVIYRGYSTSTTVSGNQVNKNYKLNVIYSTKATDSDGNVITSYQHISHDTDGNLTGVVLTYSTPGTFRILYNLSRPLWYIWSSTNVPNESKVVPVWINNEDTDIVVYEDPEDEESYTKYVCAKYITKSEYLSLSYENKLQCTVDRVYYDWVWKQDVKTKATTTTAAEYYTIHELKNVKSVKDYNSQIGIADGSYGVDMSTYANGLYESYRIYQYYRSLDANVQSELSDIDFSDNIEIGKVEDAFNIVYNGDTWLYPINSDNIDDFNELISNATEVKTDNGISYSKNGNYIFYTKDIEEELTQTTLIPIDNTGENKYKYKFANMWICSSCSDGSIMIYKPHGWSTDETTMLDAVKYLNLKELAYKYNVSTAFTIDCTVDEDTGKYLVQFSDITLTGDGIDGYSYFNSAEADVVLSPVYIDVKYTSAAEEPESASSLTKQKIRLTCDVVSDTHYGKSEYIEYGVGTYVWAYYGYDSDLSDNQIETLASSGALDIGWVPYSEICKYADSDTKEIKILDCLIYRDETDEEFAARQTTQAAAKSTYQATLLGSLGEDGTWDSSNIDTSNYVKWYSTDNVAYYNSDGKLVSSVTGGYPDTTKEQYDPTSTTEAEGLDDLFVTISETVVGTTVKASVKSITYSSDAQAVSSSTESTESTVTTNVASLDNSVWWNRYSKELTDVSEKNTWISEVGINFVGWVWLGWNGAVDSDGTLIDVSSRTLSNEGIVESYVFDDAEDYISQGFQRVLYPGQFNRSYYSLWDPTVIYGTDSEGNNLYGALKIEADSYTDEPYALLKYCTNPECPQVKNRNNKRKWSFQNMDAVAYQSNDPTAFNQFTLDDYYIPLNNGLIKAEDDNTEASFGRTGTSTLVTKLIDASDSPTGLAYDLSGFNLDMYPWHYKLGSGSGVNTRLRYMLHRGGYGIPEIFRFEFEYKYATKEYRDYRSDDDYDDIPMETRPITEYQDRYKEVIFNTFENTFIRLIHTPSPFELFNSEEISVMTDIIKELFTYDKSDPTSTDYIDFKLEIISLMQELADFEYYRTKYWNNDELSTYELNKQILIDNYLSEYLDSDNNLTGITNNEFIDLVNNQMKYYTVSVDEDSWNKYTGRTLYKIIVKRTYDALETTTVGEVISALGEIPIYSECEFKGYAKDSMGSSFYNLDSNEMNTVVRVNTSIDIYLVYEFDSFEITEAFGTKFFYNETDNQVHIKINIEDDLNKIWFAGKDNTMSDLEDQLASLHEKLALPVEFMCCLFCFVITDKRYNIVLDETGTVGSLYVSSGVSSTIKNGNTYSVSKEADGYTYKGAVISKPYNYATDNDSGRSVKEQYLVIYNTGTFDAYSFFNDGWLGDIYGSVTASAKFPLLRLKENPIEMAYGNEAELLKIFPFNNDNIESGLALVYNKGIEFVSLSDNEWITTTNTIVSRIGLFTGSYDIIDCKLDTFGDNQLLVVVSSIGSVATYDLTNMKVYASNDSSGNNIAVFDPLSSTVQTNYITNTSISVASTSVSTTAISAGVVTDDDTTLEPRVGLIQVITTLEPSDYDGKPWILNDGVTPTSITPEEISDSYYDTLSDAYQERYHIHPKLTVRYAWNKQKVDEIEVPETIDHTYQDLYTDELTKTTEGDFKIYYNGEEITLDAYFNFTDEEKADCKIYKLTTINYTFVRLSLQNTGTGIYDGELDDRLTSEMSVYALYYKTGVEVDEYYGYKILKTENIVDGSDTITTEVFDEYLADSAAESEANSSTESSNNTDVTDAWTTNNPYTEYSDNYSDNISWSSNYIKKIYPVNGFNDSTSNEYIPYYIISDGYSAKLAYWRESTMYLLVSLDYNDNNKLVDVVSVEGEMKIYLVYENQRIVVLQTSEYVPVENSIAKNHSITLMTTPDPEEDRRVFSYNIDDGRVINVYPRFSSDSSSSNSNIAIKKSTDYAGFNGEEIVSIINANIIQTDTIEHIPSFQRWCTFEGNDTKNLTLSQIN